MLFELSTNDQVVEIHNLDELRSQLAEATKTQFLELWLTAPDRWPILCALVNGDAAWLIYLRYEGDAGFSTRNPNYAGLEKSLIEFYLSNGQRDEYPASWNITTTEAMRAMEHFFTEQQRAPWLLWHED